MKKALILGLGLSGQSVARYLLNQGWHVFGTDKKKVEILPHVTFFEENEDFHFEFDLVVKSPGIPWNHPLVQKAKKTGTPITSEFELGVKAFSEKGKCLFAITGSNGKTTTTLLTTHLLNFAGIKAVAVGNVGRPLLSVLDEEAEVFVVECSSFQLEEMNQVAFSAGAILNITENHLDRYSTFQEYAQTKFQLQMCIKEKGKLFLHERDRKQFAHLVKDQNKVATIFSLEYRDGELGKSSHDLENLSAAKAFLDFAGVSQDVFWKGVPSFVKPPHRVEFVRNLKGVRYVNDSKATSSDAVIKALQSCHERLILIAGGLDKNGDFSMLGPYLEGKVKKLLLIGSGAEKIRCELGHLVETEMCDTLSNAVKNAYEKALPGECVLFSPGCASYDQFKNYEHRGDVYKKLVNELGE
jgi:UDP-N-acetylmuramoylalanine--D-glutamate ligase